jgi:hypothetical protein
VGVGRASRAVRERRAVVLCPCGSQWFGRYTIDNPVIAEHRARCGPPIGILAFQALGHIVKWPAWWTAAEVPEGGRWRRRRSRDRAAEA